MSGPVCQIPGCQTSHQEVEAELETYLSGYCQVLIIFLVFLILNDDSKNFQIVDNFVSCRPVRNQEKEDYADVPFHAA